MTPRLQADADFNGRVFRGVRRGEPAVDFLDAHEGGIVGLPDPEVLQIAAASGRILVSHDFKTMPGHFARFVEAGKFSPGLVLIPQDTLIGEAIDALLLFALASDAEEWHNCLTYLPL